MNQRSSIIITGLAATALLSLSLASLADYPIAGTAPHQRPEGAPVITAADKGPDWHEHALSGVTQPYPESLDFLKDQGNWHTPFNQPGMPAPYDIRGWHERD